MEEKIFLIIIIVSAVAVLAGLIYYKKKAVVNIVLRLVSSLLFITMCNYIIENLEVGIDLGLGVGINLVTILVSALLGIPGVMGLYAMTTYFFYI